MVFPEAYGSVCISLIYGDMCSVREVFGSKRNLDRPMAEEYRRRYSQCADVGAGSKRAWGDWGAGAAGQV